MDGRRAPGGLLYTRLAVILFSSGFLWLAAGRAHAAVSGDVACLAHPGDRLPPEVTLHDDTGALLRLGDLTDRPLLLTFTPAACGRQCPLLLGGLAEALGRLPLRPGADYVVANLSIDEEETPAQAAAAKRNYLRAIGRPFPASAWKFLTGDGDALRRVTTAVGLRYQRHGGHFFHPDVLLAVAPGGTISSLVPIAVVRHNGRLAVNFPPAELEQAVAAAQQGTIGTNRVPEPLYCLPYERDPERAFWRILKVFGAMNLIALAGILAWLVAGGRPAGGARA